MLFKKEFLLELLDSYKNPNIMETKIWNHSRWSITKRMIFKFEDKYYQTFFNVGATESQDESPYEYEDDEIECKE